MTVLGSAPLDSPPTDAGDRSFEHAARRGTDDASFEGRETSAFPKNIENETDEAFFGPRDSEDSEEEKRKRRMVSNRESARRSRQRKLARVAELQDRCATLWSDRAQTVQNIQLMESLVNRVRHENLRLDVDAGRVAHSILLMPSANNNTANNDAKSMDRKKNEQHERKTIPGREDRADARVENVETNCPLPRATAAIANANDNNDAPPPNAPPLEEDDTLLGVFAAAAA